MFSPVIIKKMGNSLSYKEQ